MLDWDTERGDKHVCLLRMWLEQIKLTCCMCVCIYLYMRETLTKIVYSQLHTEGFANQKKPRTVLPQFPCMRTQIQTFLLLDTDFSENKTPWADSPFPGSHSSKSSSSLGHSADATKRSSAFWTKTGSRGGGWLMSWMAFPERRLWQSKS